MEQENELDKKRMTEKSEMELKNITEYFNKKTEDVRKDFTEDMRRIAQLRARDKTD